MNDFGTREYWEKQLQPLWNKITDLDMHIDSLLCDVNDYKYQRL